MRYGLLGKTLGHSYSKIIHEMLGQYKYELIEVPEERLDAFLRDRNFDGLNVTIPYKQAVIPYLHEMSNRAEAIGAVNTIVNREGQLIGDNTDFGGLMALIARSGLQLKGKTVLIAGTGGTSKTARAVAKALGASSIFRLTRNDKPSEADLLTYEDAYAKCADAEILINTTPAGMYPNTEGIPVDLTRLPGLTGVIDVVYNPTPTRLVREAREQGICAESGLYMLVAQAILAAERFTGEEIPSDVTDRIYGELLRALP